jgi:AraC-like DNA-binding protein/ligand-binding sensor protein
METTLPATHAHDSRHDAAEVVALLQESETFRDYQRAFQAITGLPLALRATGSFQPPLRGSKLGNPLCSMMASRNKTCAACLEVQGRLESASGEKAGTAQCFAGLTESAVPVRLGATVIAFLQTGQVLFHLPTARETREAVKQATNLEPSLDPKALAAAFKESRVMARSQYDAILRLLAIFAQQLEALSNQLMIKQTLSEAPAITRAREYIASHVAEDITLAEVSKAVGMSSFYFCKNFKKGTGLTFTEYLSRVRIEAVKQLLLNPYKRVSEAAYEAGFQSLSQFNRVFLRITGQSPSDYRNALHTPARAEAHAA